MLAMWVKVRVKPEARDRFLKAIEVDALGSERDEPGCFRFNVLRDQQDPNVYYFYEVYRDEAALEAHRDAPHYAVWRAAADTLGRPGAGDALRQRVPRGSRLLGTQERNSPVKGPAKPRAGLSLSPIAGRGLGEGQSPPRRRSLGRSCHGQSQNLFVGRRRQPCRARIVLRSAGIEPGARPN